MGAFAPEKLLDQFSKNTESIAGKKLSRISFSMGKIISERTKAEAGEKISTTSSLGAELGRADILHRVLQDQRRGICTLESDQDGNIVPKCPSIVFRVFRSDGRVLVAIAKRVKGVMKPHPHVFPGATLRREDELMQKIAETIGTLAPLDALIQIESRHEGEEDKGSGQGILTRCECTYVQATVDLSEDYCLQVLRSDTPSVAASTFENSDLIDILYMSDFFLLASGERIYTWLTLEQAEELSVNFDATRTAIDHLIERFQGLDKPPPGACEGREGLVTSESSTGALWL